MSEGTLDRREYAVISGWSAGKHSSARIDTICRSPI